MAETRAEFIERVKRTGRLVMVATPSKRPAIPARLVEDRRYAEHLRELKAQHPDWHIRPGQALRWEGDDN